MFTGLSTFEVICNSTDATIPKARRNTVISMVSSTGLQMLILLIICGGVSLIAPIGSLQTEAVIPEAFDESQVHWIKYISVVGALPLLAVVLWNVLLDVTSVIVAMATDRVLFGCFANVSNTTDTPILASVIPGLLSALLSTVFSQHNLLALCSLSYQTVMVVCCVAALCLRYRPISMLRSPEHSDKSGHRAERARRKKEKAAKSRRNNGNDPVNTSGRYGSTNASGSNGDALVPSPNATSSATLISPTDTAPFHGQLIIEDTDEQSPVVQNGSSQFTYSAGESTENDSDSSDVDIDEAVEEYRERLRDSAFKACGIPESPTNPTPVTSRRATMAAVSFLVWAISLSAVICHAEEQVSFPLLFWIFGSAVLNMRGTVGLPVMLPTQKIFKGKR